MTTGPYGARFTGSPYTPIATAPEPASPAGPARPFVDAREATVILAADAGLNENGLISRFGPPRPGIAWLVRRITVQADELCDARVFVGDLERRNMVCFTSSGSRDENDTTQPIYVPEGQEFIVLWVGFVALSGYAVARIEYAEI